MTSGGQCLYCGGEASAVLFRGVRDRLRHVPGRWEFRQCQDCRSAMLEPRPATEHLASYYPSDYQVTPESRVERRWAHRLARWQEALVFQPHAAAQVRYLRRRIGLSRPSGRGTPRAAGARVLDLGCGQGRRLAAFRRYGYDVVGVDFQAHAVTALRRRGFHAVCSDVASLASHFPPASFDLITAFHVLEHLPDVSAVLRQVYQLLAPGGWLIGMVPLIDGLQPQVLKHRWAAVTEAPRHVSLPSQEGLRRLLSARMGFAQVAVHPGGLLESAAPIVLSVLPDAAGTHFYRHGWGRALLILLAVIAVGGVAVPWSLLENYVLCQPSIGMVLACKAKS